MKIERKDSTSDIFTSCPLCPYALEKNFEDPSSACKDQEHLQNHIASHLKFLALLSDPASHQESVLKFESGNSLSPVIQTRPPNPNLIFPRPTQLHAHPKFNQPPPPPPPGTYISPILPTTNPKFPLEIPRSPRSPQFLQAPINLNPTWTQLPRLQPHHPPNTETFDILLAEDNIVNQRVLCKMLGKHQHKVVTVGNGAEAVAAVKKRKYDVILMDVFMPVMVCLHLSLLQIKF